MTLCPNHSCFTHYKGGMNSYWNRITDKGGSKKKFKSVVLDQTWLTPPFA